MNSRISSVMVPLTITSVAKAHPVRVVTQVGSKFVLEGACSKCATPTPLPSPIIAALQSVGSRCHGDGNDLALSNSNLVRPIGIDARRASVCGQQWKAPHSRPHDFRYASATGVPDVQGLYKLRSEVCRTLRVDDRTVTDLRHWQEYAVRERVRPPVGSPRAEPCGPDHR